MVDQDRQETFDGMVGPAGSTAERLWLLATRRAHRTANKLRVSARKRLELMSFLSGLLRRKGSSAPLLEKWPFCGPEGLCAGPPCGKLPRSSANPDRA